MDKISKSLKIVFFINAIAAFVFAFFYLIIPEIYFDLVEGLIFDPYYWRAFGATCLVLGIFSIRTPLKGEPEQAKLLLEIAILWLLAILLLNIWELFTLPISATYRATTLFDCAIVIVLIVLNAYFYRKELK